MKFRGLGRWRLFEAKFSPWKPSHVWAAIFILAIVLETVTAAVRFTTGFNITRDTGFIGPLTGGLRIHHSYIGLLVLLLSLGIRNPSWRRLFIICGGGIFLSDVLHHFLILWPLTGSPEFDLVYPRQS